MKIIYPKLYNLFIIFYLILKFMTSYNIILHCDVIINQLRKFNSIIKKNV